MQVKVLQVGPIGTNCYLLEDEKAHVAAVIDPGDEAGRILQVIKDDGVDVKYILLTHGHYDHTTAVPELHQALPQAEIYIHKADANGAGSRLFPLAGQIPDLKFYDEGDALTLGELTIQVLHTLPQPPVIFVGGAVVTEEYAEAIGAVYSSDAQNNVKILENMFSNI